jgi:hypothetical protein
MRFQAADFLASGVDGVELALVAGIDVTAQKHLSLFAWRGSGDSH